LLFQKNTAPGYGCCRLPRILWTYGALWETFFIIAPIMYAYIFNARKAEISECKDYVNGLLDTSNLDDLYLENLYEKCGEPIDCNEIDQELIK